jgi:hypothetical protein
MRSYLELGKWNVICDRCSFEFKNDELRKEWTGLMVCCNCYETRHPQTLIKVPEEQIAVPWSRPEPADVFMDPYIQTDGGYIALDITTELGSPLNV